MLHRVRFSAVASASFRFSAGDMYIYIYIYVSESRAPTTNNPQPLSSFGTRGAAQKASRDVGLGRDGREALHAATGGQELGTASEGVHFEGWYGTRWCPSVRCSLAKLGFT